MFHITHFHVNSKRFCMNMYGYSMMRYVRCANAQATCNAHAKLGTELDVSTRHLYEGCNTIAQMRVMTSGL